MGLMESNLNFFIKLVVRESPKCIQIFTLSKTAFNHFNSLVPKLSNVMCIYTCITYETHPSIGSGRVGAVHFSIKVPDPSTSPLSIG